MRAAAFQAGQGRARDQHRGLEDVVGFALPPAVHRRQAGTPLLQLLDGLAQPRAGAHDADVLPRQVAHRPDNLFRSVRVGDGAPARCRFARFGVGVGAGWRRLFADGCAGARAIHQAFEQRVAGQPVGAVHSGTGGLARGVESGQAGAPVQIRAHAAHGVMRRRPHRDQVGADVDVVLQAGGVDAREARCQVVGIEMRQVEVHHRVGQVRDLELVGDGAGHHVARRQFRHLVVLGHEANHLYVAQVRAFSAQRL